MAPHSSILAWKIPWTEESDGLQSKGSQRVRHDWVTKQTHTPGAQIYTVEIQLIKQTTSIYETPIMSSIFCSVFDRNVYNVLVADQMKAISLNKCGCAKFTSVVSDSLRPHGLQPTRLLCPWDSPGKNTRVGCHALLQGVFPNQELNPGLLHCRKVLYPLSQVGLNFF